MRNVEQSCLRGGLSPLPSRASNPPAMARNWGQSVCVEREEKPWKDCPPFHRISITPKEWLGPRFLADAEHLKEKNETAYRHEYLGKWLGAAPVFENLKLEPIPDEMAQSFDRVYTVLTGGVTRTPGLLTECNMTTRAELFTYSTKQQPKKKQPGHSADH